MRDAVGVHADAPPPASYLTARLQRPQRGAASSSSGIQDPVRESKCDCHDGKASGAPVAACGQNPTVQGLTTQKPESDKERDQLTVVAADS